MTANPDREIVRWSTGGKMKWIEMWSSHVMSDHRLTKSEIHVAWALTFSFNSEDARSWETKAAIAKRVGLSVSAVKAALTGLDRAGHIVRSTEVIGGKQMRVIRPSLSRSMGNKEPRPRRGGVAKGVNPSELAAERRGTEAQSSLSEWGTDPQSSFRTDVQAPGGTEAQAPCILDESWTNPRVDVAGVVTGRTSPAGLDLDDDEDDSIPMPWTSNRPKESSAA